MSRRDRQRVSYSLDSSGVRKLNPAEIEVILRGADTMIARGGRTQLSKLLKGSREKSLLEHGLDRCPAYGFYRHLSIDEVLHRIDWTIEHGYMRIEYNRRLPLLVFTERGWASRSRRWRRSCWMASMSGASRARHTICLT